VKKISKFSKHIGEGEKLIINGDEFILKPLGIEFSGDFLNINKGFSGAKILKDTDGNELKDKEGNPKPDVESLYKNFNDKTTESIKKVVLATLELSYPNEPPEELNTFAGKYLMQLLPVIQGMNSGGSVDKDSRAKRKIEAIQRIKAKQ